MAEFVTLSCPSCGGKLQIPNGIDRCACGFCGNEHVINRGGGIVSLAPIMDGIKKVSSGVELTAAELAIARIEKEIKELEKTPIKHHVAGDSGCFVWLAIALIAIFFVSWSLGLHSWISVSFVVFGILFFMAYFHKSDEEKIQNKEIDLYNDELLNRIKDKKLEKEEYLAKIYSNK